MRHAKKKHQLNRFTTWHESTVRLLAMSLIKHQSIKTTLARAKATRPLAEKLISLAKTNTLAAKRAAFKVLGDHALVSSLFSDIGPRFKSSGGYTRIVKLGSRRGDNADMVIFELTEIKKKEVKKTKKGKEAAKVGAEDTQEEVKEVKEVKIDEKKREDSFDSAKEKPSTSGKPSKKFLGGIRSIFKKQRDAL